MSWTTLPPELRELVEEVCTRTQIDALELWDSGVSLTHGAMVLEISVSAFRGRVARAQDTLLRERRRRGLSLP